MAAAIAGPILFSVLLAKLYGALNTTEGWNIAYVACALARDTSWYECDARAAEILKGFGSTQDRADVLFALASEAFRTDPWKLVAKLTENVSAFLKYVWLQHAGRLRFSLSHVAVDGNADRAGVDPGCRLLFCPPRPTARRQALWFGLFAAIALSAMIMFHHDGWRTLYATHPLLAHDVCARLCQSAGGGDPAAADPAVTRDCVLRNP